MTNNDILRRLRYAFNFNDAKMIQLFGLGEMEVTREEVIGWLKKNDAPEWKSLYDKHLATFLNGMIIDKRGKKDGDQLKAEKTLNNNMILRKLRIALMLNEDDMLEIIEAGGMSISKHELSAFFRKPEHSNYRLCRDQILRNFLVGLQVKYRQDT